MIIHTYRHLTICIEQVQQTQGSHFNIPTQDSSVHTARQIKSSLSNSRKVHVCLRMATYPSLTSIMLTAIIISLCKNIRKTNKIFVGLLPLQQLKRHLALSIQQTKSHVQYVTSTIAAASLTAQEHTDWSNTDFGSWDASSFFVSLYLQFHSMKNA